ncbi:MAG: DUF4366 domain-containing protein [Oscillospiraceae bacterium]|nr:DUF4366 domain-containing protein [Oscillospiraceae bacterium]
MRIKRMMATLAVACALLVGTVTVFADEEEVVVLDEPATTESVVTTVKEAETVPMTTHVTTVTAPETESVTTEPVITIISGNVDIVTDSVETEEVEEETNLGNSFSVEGNGEVLDDITDDSEMEFLTITTANGNIFYLIIDRSSDNVYMLSTIDEYDLQDFIEIEEEADTTTTTSQGSVVLEDEAVSTGNTEDTSDTETPAVTVDEESSGSMSVVIIVLIIAVAVGGGAYFYLKVYKPKHEADNYKSENMEIGDGLEIINEDEVKESDGSQSEE